MSKISIQEMEIKGVHRQGVYLENIILVSLFEIKEGISKKTGQPWKFMPANFRYALPDGSSMFLRLKLRGDMVDRFSNCQPGTLFNALVRFDIEGASFLTNEYYVLYLDVTSNPQ